MGEGKKGGSEEVDLKTKTFDEIFMELVLPGVNRHNFVTRWNFISIFLTLKVFRFSHLSSSTRIFWRYQLRFVSMYPREKSINFPLFSASTNAHFEWHSSGFYGLFSFSLAKMKAKKFFFMFTQKQPEKFNFSDMIFVRQKNLFQGFAPTGPARFSSHHNKSAETPRGPQKSWSKSNLSCWRGKWNGIRDVKLINAKRPGK